MLDSAKENAYIHDGKEVRLTGRIAKKPIYHRRKFNEMIGEMTIVEIPHKIGNLHVIGDPNLAQWVNPRELFYVILDDEIDSIDVDKLIEMNKQLEEDNE